MGPTLKYLLLILNGCGLYSFNLSFVFSIISTLK